MIDTVSKEKRSEIMSKIRSKDTKIELKMKRVVACLRKFQTEGGPVDIVEIIKNWSIEKWIFHPEDEWEHPDLIIHELNVSIAVYIDGCFWHKCPIHYKPPKSNVGYWLPKIERNVEVAIRNTKLLIKQGRRVLRIWEHTINALPILADQGDRDLVYLFVRCVDLLKRDCVKVMQI